MREIILTKNKVSIISDEDYQVIKKYKWFAVKGNGNSWYASRYINMTKKPRERIFMHRQIVGNTNKMVIDHVDGNGLNNQRNNLRICSHIENCQNKKHPQRHNKLKVKGVYLYRNNKFVAQIRFNKKLIHLGYFNVLGDADSAYRFAEEKLFGTFSRNWMQ